MAPVGRIVADGRARLRRHNIAYAAVAVTAVAAVVALAAAVVPLTSTRGTGPGLVDNHEPVPGQLTLESSLAAWADGDAVHYRGVEAQRPDGPLLLTVTSTSAVYVSGAETGGTVRTLDDDGRVREIGTSNGTGVVADPTASWIAWMQETGEGGSVELVLHNTQTHETVNSTQVASATAGAPASVVAVDGSLVTYTSSDGLFVWDWVSDEVEPADLPAGDELLDSRDGVHVVRRGGRLGETVMFLGRIGKVRPALALDSAQLSPDGQYAIGYAGASGSAPGWTVSLSSTVDGTQVPLSGLPGEPLVAGWTSGNSLVVLSSDEPAALDSPAHVSLCRTNGECRTPPDAPEGNVDEVVVASGGMGLRLLSSLSGAGRDR
jgi:hypothetical protein